VRWSPIKGFGSTVAVVVLLTGCGSADLHGAPNVKGLALPDARAELKRAGYEASVKTDALFGVIIEEHFTVCDENSPNGRLVPITANKQC
jgi:hypothetical protein